jgi:hypothetical protein
MPSPGITAIRKLISLQDIGPWIQKDFGLAIDTTYIVLTEERALSLALGKMRRLRRMRRLGRLAYWAAWGVAGVLFVLLLAGGIAGLASG